MPVDRDSFNRLLELVLSAHNSIPPQYAYREQSLQLLEALCDLVELSDIEMLAVCDQVRFGYLDWAKGLSLGRQPVAEFVQQQFFGDPDYTERRKALNDFYRGDISATLDRCMFLQGTERMQSVRGVADEIWIRHWWECKHNWWKIKNPYSILRSAPVKAEHRPTLIALKRCGIDWRDGLSSAEVEDGEKIMAMALADFV